VFDTLLGADAEAIAARLHMSKRTFQCRIEKARPVSTVWQSELQASNSAT